MKATSLIFTALLTLLVTHITVAQVPSNNGKFTADASKGCANLVVRVTNAYCVTESCSYQKIKNGVVVQTGEFDNAKAGFDTVHFPAAGTYTLSIVVGTTGVNNDEIRIDVSPSTPPDLEAYSCNGGNVFVRVLTPTYPFYVFDYGDGAPVTKPAINAYDIHTYVPAPVTPTPRTVNVTGSNGTGANDASCLARTSTVTVANTLPAADIRRVEVLDPGSSVKVDFDTDPSIQYRFMVATNNATGFQQYAQLYSDQATTMTQTLANVPAHINYYCFRVNTYNPCDNVVAASSPVVCSLNLTATAQNNENDLTWSTAAASASHPLTDITITKNDGALPNVAPTPAAYADTDVTCQEPYTYRLTAHYTGGAQSLSLPKSVTAFSNNIPPAIADISAQVDGTNVTLTWPEVAVPASAFSLVKTVGGVPGTAEEFTTLPFIDPAYATTAPTCYRVTYTDRCGNTSLPSPDACPIQLTGSLRPDNTVDLTWSAYSGWTSPVSTYSVSLYDDQGNLVESTDAGNLTTFTEPGTRNPDNQVCTYVITARAADGTLDPSVSNAITLIKAPNLYYPTGFTPNRDGTNDTFRVFGQRYVVSFEMKVFNRWGEMMYSTSDKDDAGWDGTYKGNLQPEGTYVFTATVVDRAGRTFERSGAFYLLRKK